MKAITAEWVAKAEADYVSSGREFRARKAPNYDLACFCAQQCAEKYLKAALQDAEIAFSKSHNLVLLLDLLRSDAPELELLRPDLHDLTSFAIDFRYPEKWATKETARDALARCARVRDVVRAHLGLATVEPARRPKKRTRPGVGHRAGSEKGSKQ